MTDLERKVFKISAVVGTSLTLGVLLCDAMGWLDGHLHRFYQGRDGRAPYFMTEFDLEEDLECDGTAGRNVLERTCSHKCQKFPLVFAKQQIK